MGVLTRFTLVSFAKGKRIPLQSGTQKRKQLNKKVMKNNIVFHARFYPENSKGNRIIIDKAEFSDPNMAKDVFYFLQKREDKAKRGYFLGLMMNDKPFFKTSFNTEEKKVFDEEVREDFDNLIRGYN